MHARLRPLSIRTRLTLWYACSIVLLFAAVAPALRFAVRRTLLAEFDDDAVDSSALVSHFFHVEASEYPTAEQAVTDLVAEVVFPDRAIHFIRPDGSILAPVTKTAPAPLRPPLRTLIVPLDREHAPGWSIRVTSSAADLERMLQSVDRWFLVGAPVIALFAAGLGWTIAGRLLQPVDAMARAAEGITAAQSAARLPIRNQHDEIGRLGAAFNELLTRLDGALAQKHRFLADAAHELRSPIARMAGVAELALATAQAAASVEDPMRLIASDLQQARRLVDELLQLARADAGERMQQAERVFLDDIVMDAVRSWSASAQAAGVALAVVDVAEAPIVADPVFVRRVMDILLENAVRYTPRGGRIQASVSVAGANAVLIVSDTGIGIPPDELPRVFERFFRGATSRPMAPEGSGLGLPIAAWIVDQCGGSIGLSPAASGGTIACVTLPLAV